jgi:cellulose synthase/poly-beta-1,6-N-acetylglucosamine synthase-like glycosyltransferase
MKRGPESMPSQDSLASRPAAATPLSWRVAALALLGGGMLVGYLAARKKSGGVVARLAAGVAIGAAVPVARASRRPPITPDDAAGALEETGSPPTFTVLVAARDEAAVLPGLVRDVGRQDYRDAEGLPRFELVVVDDRSIDGSGEAVLTAACLCGIEAVTRVVRREGDGLADGKGAALSAVQPEACRGDVVLVLDADARIEPSFLRRAAGYFGAGADAVTARRRIMGEASGWLAGVQGDEQTLDGELNRGRWAMGGCSEFRGNGIMIRRDLLAAVGGWRAAALTEDIDLSSRLAVAGKNVAWAIDAEVWEEPVRDLPALWRQRLRWAEGALRRAFEQGPAVVTSERLAPRARLDFAAYVGQLAVPPLILGAGLAALRGRIRALLLLLAGYAGVSFALGWDSLRWSGSQDGGPIGVGERLRRAVRLSVFSAIWLGAVPRALLSLGLRRGAVRYEKMPHSGGQPGGASRRRERPGDRPISHR